jgi:undecaprenyl-diphosphatase
VLVALSRLVLGLHYPSDVLAGILLGAALASLTLQI